MKTKTFSLDHCEDGETIEEFIVTLEREIPGSKGSIENGCGGTARMVGIILPVGKEQDLADLFDGEEIGSGFGDIDYVNMCQEG